MHPYTTIVLGAGPAGYTCAIRIAQLGGTVALIERDYVGGICVNWGCTPSKAMIESAKIAKIAREASYYGIEIGNVRVNFARVAKRRDRVMESAREHIAAALNHHGVTVMQGEGEILDRSTVRVHRGQLDPDGYTMHRTGESEDITGKHIVIATGSAPLIPPGFDVNDPTILKSNELISIQELPPALTIVGGGVIGLEFATIFSNLGTKVTIVELQDRILPWLDEEVGQAVTKHLNDAGVEIRTSCKVLSLARGIICTEDQRTKKSEEWKSPVNLIAIGRRAVVNDEAYKRLGLTYTPKGVDIDGHLQTNVPGVWAIGDATGKSILAHVGMQQGIVCAENVMAEESKAGATRTMDYSVIPAVIYTIPEVATVGVEPKDMTGVTIIKVPFTANLRAAIEENKEGYVKAWIKDGKLLAAHVVGFTASEIIQEYANMIALRSTIEEVSRIIHAHPTYTEQSRIVFEHALGRAIEYFG